MKSLRLNVCVLFLIQGLAFHVNAQSVAKDHSGAVKSTAEDLVNPKKRKESLKTPEAIKMNAEVEAFFKSEKNIEEIYNISSDVLYDLAAEAKSPEDLTQMLEKFKKDPEAFYQKLSPAQKKRIKDLSETKEVQESGKTNRP